MQIMYFPDVQEIETLKAMSLFPIYKLSAHVGSKTGQNVPLRSSY